KSSLSRGLGLHGIRAEDSLSAEAMASCIRELLDTAARVTANPGLTCWRTLNLMLARTGEIWARSLALIRRTSPPRFRQATFQTTIRGLRGVSIRHISNSGIS